MWKNGSQVQETEFQEGDETENPMADNFSFIIL